MEKRLPGLVINSYGFANFAFTLMMFMAINYYSAFLTNVALISAAHVAIMMFITHVVDAFSVPYAGSLIQRTQMRWGRFRSWLLVIPLSTCIFFTLTFTNLPLSYGLKVVFLCLVYMIAHVSLNFAFNGHLGLISILTKTVEDRLNLSARNIQFGMASQILFSIAVIPLLLGLRGKYGDSLGFFYTLLILGIFQIIGYWNVFFQTKDRETYQTDIKIDPSSKMNIKDMLNQIFGNVPLILLMVADCMVNLGIFALSTFAFYYFTYVTGDESFMTYYTLFLGLATFTSTFIGPYMVKFIGKKATYMFGGAYGVIGFLILRQYGDMGPWIYTGIVCATVLGTGVSSPIRHAMYMDTAEYGFFKTGKDASGFIVSMFTLPVKIGIALATTLANVGLHLIGWEADMVTTPEFIGRLMDIICYIPLACGFFAFFIMLFYPLTSKKLAMCMEANAVKRAEANAG